MVAADEIAERLRKSRPPSEFAKGNLWAELQKDNVYAYPRPLLSREDVPVSLLAPEFEAFLWHYRHGEPKPRDLDVAVALATEMVAKFENEQTRQQRLRYLLGCAMNVFSIKPCIVGKGTSDGSVAALKTSGDRQVSVFLVHVEVGRRVGPSSPTNESL